MTSTSEGFPDVWLCVGEGPLIALIRTLHDGSRVKVTGDFVAALDVQGHAITRPAHDVPEVPLYCFDLDAIELAKD
ncbi:MAG: hypothetical protein ABSG98_06355 [Anaerolineales bacterium]|jgi:hypothetical protein